MGRLRLDAMVSLNSNQPAGPAIGGQRADVVVPLGEYVRMAEGTEAHQCLNRTSVSDPLLIHSSKNMERRGLSSADGLETVSGLRQPSCVRSSCAHTNIMHPGIGLSKHRWRFRRPGAAGSTEGGCRQLAPAGQCMQSLRQPSLPQTRASLLHSADGACNTYGMPLKHVFQVVRSARFVQPRVQPPHSRILTGCSHLKAVVRANGDGCSCAAAQMHQQRDCVQRDTSLQARRWTAVSDAAGTLLTWSNNTVW
jgi:hypothetical protein